MGFVRVDDAGSKEFWGFGLAASRRRSRPRAATAAARTEPLEQRVLLTVMPDVNFPEFRVNTSQAGDNADPDVAMDDDGDSVVVWQRQTPDDARLTVMAQVYDHNGLPKGSEFIVNSYGPIATNPAVAMDEDGDFVVAWTGFQDEGPDIGAGVWARRFNVNGAPYGLPFRVSDANDNPGTSLYDPREVAVASDDAGNFVVTWHEMPPQGTPGPTPQAETILARTYNTRLDPTSSVFRVDTPNDFLFKSDVGAAMDADGDFVITWHGATAETGGSEEIAARRFNKQGQPQGNDFRVDTPTRRPQLKSPSVSMAPDGRFVVVWIDSGDDEQIADTVRARLYDASGNARGSVRKLMNSLRAFATSSGPDVAMDDNGNFVVIVNLNIPDSGGGGGGGGGGIPNLSVENLVAYGQYDANANLQGNLVFPSDTFGASNMGYVSVAVEADLSDALIVYPRSDLVTFPPDNEVFAMHLFDPAVPPDPEPVPPPPNTPPTTSGIANVVVAMDAANTTIPLYSAFADAQDPDNLLRYRVISNNNANLFSSIAIDPATGVLTLDYAPNTVGTATLIVQATDFGNASVEAPFTVTVTGTPNPTPNPGPGPGPAPGPSLAGPYAVTGRLYQKPAGKGKGKKVGVDGVQVFLDANDNGTHDANEPVSISANGGFYTFSGIAAGRYKVRPVDPGAWQVVAKRSSAIKPLIVKARPQRKPGKIRPVVLQAAAGTPTP